MDTKGLTKYLKGEAQDYQSLEEHDKTYHKGGYHEGDACKVREALKKSDNPDKMLEKSNAFEGRTNMRKEYARVLKDIVGGNIRFDENESPYDRYVSFQSENIKPKCYESLIEFELDREGYNANLNFGSRNGVRVLSGRIRKLTPKERFNRVKEQKPGRRGHWGVWEVDGHSYTKFDEAMEVWKAAMKKYGGQVKHGVNGTARDEYLKMCEE